MWNPKRTLAHHPVQGILSMAAASLLVASLPLAAQSRSQGHSGSSSSSGGGGGRTAHEVGGSSSPSHSGDRSPSSSSSSGSGWQNSGSSGDGGGGGSSSSAGSHPPRTAHPGSPGGSQRQPSSRGRDGRGFRGGHGHVIFSSPFFYPGSFWWDSWWGYPYGYPYGNPGYGGYGGYGRYGDGRYNDDFGALDLDVSPARTQVFLDGEYVGTVDDFDGWPRYLWLEKGTYDLAFYLDGYKTIARQVTVYPGLVLDFDDRMEQGPSTKPEDLPSKSHERRDARQRYESERQEELDRDGDRDGDHNGGDRQEGAYGSSWRDRMRRQRVIIKDRNDDREEASEGADGRESRSSANADSGRLKVDVEPDDASVYLDGKFVGTGADLSKMAAGLPVEPGSHKLSVVRPGRKPEDVSFKVEAGAEVDLEVQLDEKSGE